VLDFQGPNDLQKAEAWTQEDSCNDSAVENAKTEKTKMMIPTAEGDDVLSHERGLGVGVGQNQGSDTLWVYCRCLMEGIREGLIIFFY